MVSLLKNLCECFSPSRPLALSRFLFGSVRPSFRLYVRPYVCPYVRMSINIRENRRNSDFSLDGHSVNLLIHEGRIYLPDRAWFFFWSINPSSFYG